MYLDAHFQPTSRVSIIQNSSRLSRKSTRSWSPEEDRRGSFVTGTRRTMMKRFKQESESSIRARMPADSMRTAQLIRQSDPKLRDLLLGSLLSEASIHANTGGVFKGFYKDPDTGIGKYGGKGEDALERIMAMTGRNKYSREVVAYEQAARTHQARAALPNPPRTGGTSRGIMD